MAVVRPTRVPRVLRVAAALLAVTSASLVAAAPAQAAPPRIDLVNLGDSFSAAVGTGGVGPTPPLGCLQGQGPDHVSRLQRRPGVVLLVDAACSGATSADVRAVVALPQVTAALGQAELVTLTLGGNDVGWTSYLAACSRAGEAAAPGVCDLLLGQGDARIVAAAASAARTLADVDAATEGVVVVLGYPHLVDDTRDTALVTAARATQLNELTDRLSSGLRDAALSEGARFADVTDRFDGHGVGSDDPWLFFDPTNPTRPDTFHPTATGYLRGYYAALADTVVLGRLGRG